MANGTEWNQGIAIMDDKQLRKSVEQQIKRMQRAEKERPTLLAQSIFMGTLSLLFVLPVILGAYLGNWLDDKSESYSIQWTIGLIVVGLIIGMVNVYLYVREHH
ncbi:AtpZ/AtpI family protein [Nitrosomonas supralitoralis]|nr:AtpZ/AtpI family protein [Nitrosomonas supralitoralis]